jgi:hypothetical protein
MAFNRCLNAVGGYNVMPGGCAIVLEKEQFNRVLFTPAMQAMMRYAFRR